MNTYLIIFAIALSSSLLLTPIVRRLAQRLGWLDVPGDDRRLHYAPVPRLGGVAIFLSVAAAVATVPLVDNLVSASLRESSQQLVAVVVSSTIVFLFGLFDDLVGANAKWKFAAQGVAGVTLYLLGGRIEAASIPFFGSVELPPLVGFLLTLIWVVGISNAFNLIDGLDGLAAGASLFAALVMLVVSLFHGHVLVIVVTLALAGALIGFLRYNFNPASIFLGDSGSLFIGFLLAAISLLGSQKASTAVAVAIPLMAFGLPVIDTAFALTRRFISGRPLFGGDREHIHHKLLERGWSQRRVAFVLYGVCALFGIVALLFVSDGGGGKTTGLLLLVIGAAIVLIAGRLRYHEVDEVRASVRRNFLDRRVRGANNVAVRRATREVAKAVTLSELLGAVEQVLALGEFVHASVELSRGNDVEFNAKAFERERSALTARGAYLSDGIICWEWRRSDAGPGEVLDSGLFWTMRLPLSSDAKGWGFVTFYRDLDSDHLLLDVNYLIGFFQREMTRAAERIFKEFEASTGKPNRLSASARLGS